MTYRDTSKRKKVRSMLGVAAREANRMNSHYEPPAEIDYYMKITIERRATGETAVFECFEGDRINNYAVTCNGEFKGIQSITALMSNIRKALPSFRRFDE